MESKCGIFIFTTVTPFIVINLSVVRFELLPCWYHGFVEQCDLNFSFCFHLGLVHSIGLIFICQNSLHAPRS